MLFLFLLKRKEELRHGVGVPMKNLFQKKFIYFIVGVISILLALNIVLTYYNNSIIKRNEAVQEEVERARFYYDQIGKSVIHSADIGLRGFSIVRNEQFVAPFDNARIWKDSILSNAEHPLIRLHYDMSQFKVFKDSLDSYIVFCAALKQLLVQERDAEFKQKFSADRGAHLWWMYLELEKDIQGYINQIDEESQANYKAALFRNQILQVILFLICVPTLIYTAIYTGKTNRLSELLRKAAKEKNRILREQNVTLEHKVVERTQEIASQNDQIKEQSEELAGQRDTLILQNKQLQEAGQIIEEQNAEIQAMNEYLTREVNIRTSELQDANQELIDQNNQLEQYAFITAHNLRAPLARILGLTHLIKISETETERSLIFDKLVTSTKDLDHVIRDLNTILNIKKHTSNLTEVDLEDSFIRVKRMLEKEIEDTDTKLTAAISPVRTVYAVAPYVDSIFYNLIGNAIKYRDPERVPEVTIETKIENGFVRMTVRDNGLGIDLKKYKSNMFTLYKRFHLHMEGKGLGLYLVKTQIEAVGGKIEVESEPYRGTTFHVYFKRHSE
jgi:signal transduction histidine kinase